ncbi:MAG: Tim44 domain-containing protein, partial [Clostridia bacterium]|nr:Tim44 domain-containing protein [Clostridia bacterium]
RAGGGSSGGGGGGGGGGGSSTHHSTGRGSGSGNPFALFLPLGAFILISSAAAIAYRLRLSKYARNTKKLLTMLERKDSAWKYKNILRQVKTAYFAIQKGWTAMDLSLCKVYMTESLRENFHTKLSWMQYQRKKNVLKKVKLSDAIPVSLYDDPDDSKDFVWFYIKGRMVDYTIDVDTNRVIDGSTIPGSFEEYWQFTRTSGGGWVLNQILQKDEAEQIPFSV